MDFSDALKAMKAGKKIATKSMMENGWLEIRKIQCDQGASQKRIVFCNKDTNHWNFYEFVDSHLLANDWEVIEDIPEVKTQTQYTVVYTCPECLRVVPICFTKKTHKCDKCGKEVRIVIGDKTTNPKFENKTIEEYKRKAKTKIKEIEQYTRDFPDESTFGHYLDIEHLKAFIELLDELK